MATTATTTTIKKMRMDPIGKQSNSISNDAHANEKVEHTNESNNQTMDLQGKDEKKNKIGSRRTTIFQIIFHRLSAYLFHIRKCLLI